jgi:predicted small metal-binding protein
MSRRAIPTDWSEESGCVICCPLCQHRITSDSQAEGWRRIYRHLRDSHHEMHAARLAEDARRNMQRSRR